MKAKPVLTVILSAVLFGVSTPLAKILLDDISPLALAGLLYLGVFAGLVVFSLARKGLALAQGPSERAREASLERRDYPWLAGAVLAGGIIAPVCLMLGLDRISGFSASLLLNFEGAATALIAALVFKESAGRKIWAALALMTAAGVLLSWSPGKGEITLGGPILIILAMIGWGVDNNLTRRISDKDPLAIARIKGLVAGAVIMTAATLAGNGPAVSPALAFGLLVGAVGYGASLVLFIRGLQGLGAFRTGLFFSFGPFVGAAASLGLLGETATWPMAAAAGLMTGGVLLIAGERHSHPHRHERTVHAHSHTHRDPHHGHAHPEPGREPHAHEHIHEGLKHEHGHWPDTHHRHGH